MAFDIITCLWNVLGHVDGNKIDQALTNIYKHLSSNGLAIIDVNNRHNIKQYGKIAIKNVIKDFFNYEYSNGDIHFDMKIGEVLLPSDVHVFTASEIEKLFNKNKLEIVKKKYVNYKTGKIENNKFSGQIFYVLRRKV